MLDARNRRARCLRTVTVLVGTNHEPTERCACQSHSRAMVDVGLLNRPPSVPILDIFDKSIIPRSGIDLVGAQKIQVSILGLL
jgi:hypothetical protein